MKIDDLKWDEELEEEAKSQSNSSDIRPDEESVEPVEETTDTLFSEVLFVKQILESTEEAKRALEKIKPNYISDPNALLIFSICRDYFREYGHIPTQDIIIREVTDPNPEKVEELKDDVREYLSGVNSLDLGVHEKYWEDAADIWLAESFAKSMILKSINLVDGTIEGDVYEYMANIKRPSLFDNGVGITLNPSTELLQNPPPPRQYLMDPIISEKSVTFVSGETGSGKTMLILAMLDAMSKGIPFGPWKCDTPIKVCIIDGEMAIQDLHERLQQMETNENLMYWSRDEMWGKDDELKGDMSDPIWRAAVTRALKANDVKLIATDNLSSLAPYLNENAKEDYDPINQWLLELRFEGISSMLLHHMGKEGKGQRGHSGRIDNVDNAIEVNFAPGYNKAEDGCKFVISFTKFRAKVTDKNALRKRVFHYTENGDGRYEWNIEDVSTQEQVDDVVLLRDIVSGLNQTLLAEKHKKGQSTIHRRVKKYEKEGLIEKDINGKWELTNKGITFTEKYIQDVFFEGE